jgi:hypothetical protein
MSDIKLDISIPPNDGLVVSKKIDYDLTCKTNFIEQLRSNL